MSDTQLQFAKDITAQVKNAWLSGDFLEKVTPTTRNLLTYWFDERYKEVRDIHFHEGQMQSILNIVYIHEVLKAKNLMEVYQHFLIVLLCRLK